MKQTAKWLIERGWKREVHTMEVHGTMIARRFKKPRMLWVHPSHIGFYSFHNAVRCDLASWGEFLSKTELYAEFINETN